MNGTRRHQYDRRYAPHGRISIDDFAQIVARACHGFLGFSNQSCQALPAQGALHGCDLIFASSLGGQHRFRHAEQSPHRSIEHLRPINRVLLCARSARRKMLPSILSNIVMAASVRIASISRTKTTRVAKRRGVSNRERCWALRMAVSRAIAA